MSTYPPCSRPVWTEGGADRNQRVPAHEDLTVSRVVTDTQTHPLWLSGTVMALSPISYALCLPVPGAEADLSSFFLCPAGRRWLPTRCGSKDNTLSSLLALKAQAGLSCPIVLRLPCCEEAPSSPCHVHTAQRDRWWPAPAAAVFV